MIKSTDHLENMVKRALRKGMRADYILMDSWFCFPYADQWLRFSTLYGKRKKRPDKAKILISVLIETKTGQKVKIVFVRHRHKKSWIALMSMDTNLGRRGNRPHIWQEIEYRGLFPNAEALLESGA